MSGTPAPTPIGAGATQKLGGTRTGWGITMTTAVGDTVTVRIIETPDDSHNAKWVGTKRGHSDTASFRATFPGWHRVRVGIDPNGEMNATATHEGFRLKKPYRSRPEDGIHLFWLDPDEEPQTRTAARDLARYFIMGWTKLEEGGIARELHQRRDDVYPELSQIGLDNELALKTLADEPEHLDEDDWDQLEECGRLVIEILDRTSE